MSNHIIEVKHLNKSFENKHILKDINFYVRKGEFITFLGPSGCGKTTLLRLIGGFLKPDDGEIILNGQEISSIPPYKRPLNTVFQRYGLFPNLDVYDNVAFGLKLKGTPKDKIEKTVHKMLKMVSMTDYEDRSVDSLSGGQQQRVAIARALANNPQILLLDEPLAALDLKMRKDMQMELKELHKKMGITFIYVTHDQEEALTLSDTIVVMDGGRIQQIGTPEDIYNEPKNSFVADFIGASTIVDGTMICDKKVNFLGHDFECVDEGFGENTPVDVVIRPEDVYIMNKLDGSQFSGVVKSTTFKGVHYEMFVDTDKGYELMVQDYNYFEPGSTVGLLIRPSDIQVMHKERLLNSIPATVIDENHVEMLGGVFECDNVNGRENGTVVTAEIDFDKIELMDYQDEGNVCGEVRFILYKGNYYHLKIRTDNREYLYVNTNDVWDYKDLVGIKIKPKDIRLK